MRSAKVLIVEDERLIALDLETRLKRLGYEIVARVSTGEKALIEHDLHGPDVVLMDIHLQGRMDGTEVARIINSRRATPVVYLTAYAEDGTINRALEGHPYGYLVKPVDTKELHAMLQTALARHDVDRALALSEHRLQLAVEVAGVGVWEWTRGNDQFTADRSFARILDQEPVPLHESLSDFLDRLLDEDRQTVEHLLRVTIAQDRRVNGSFRYRNASGDVGWLEVHAQIFDQDTKDEQIIGVIKDVTDQKNTHAALQESAAVFDIIAEGLFTLNAEGRLQSANPAFAALTGYALDDIVDKDPDDFLHARRHSDHFYRVLAANTGGSWQGEIWCRRKNGKVFPAWECISAVFDDERKVTGYVAAITDISRLRRAEEQVNHMAYHDPLTGLPNRALFSERLTQAVERAAAESTSFALMFLDLDGFKSINDTLGHTSGDLLLQTVGARIKGLLRATDTVARLGGDEFVALTTDLEQPGTAAWLANRLLDALTAPITLGGESVSISASIGIAIYPSDGADGPALMRAADTAMYAAKAQGKNRVCPYTVQLAEHMADRMSLEQGLRQALASDQFVLYFQPQFTLADGTMAGVEALIRWIHPTRGMIPPVRFIPIAEEIGLIEAIGAWVLRTACAQVAAWMAESGVPLRLSVNVSARQMRTGGIVDVLRQTLAETGFPPDLLEIEITESTLQVLEDSRKLLLQVHELGVGVAIDDFGTGYSSLSVLKHLPIDRLKIDKSFVQDLPHDANDVGIVEAIVAMAGVLGIKLVAEGVESPEQLEWLKQVHCSEAQGYLLGRPVPWDELRDLLDSMPVEAGGG